MISIIVCSIHESSLRQLCSNVELTVGIPFELITFDNTALNWGIGKVYNDCARKAKYDYLCFCHEDVLFETHAWGKHIVSKLHDTDCGVIGFAGSTCKSRQLSGWSSGNHRCIRYNLTEIDALGKKRVMKKHVGEDTFSRVIVLDGCCLFVRKDVWQQYPFDEKMFSNFHLYDLDFSFQIAQKYNNYVCNSVKIIHLSSGSYTEKWIEDTKKFHEKWKKVLPLYISKPSGFKIDSDEIRAARDYLRLLKNSSSPFFDEERKRVFKQLSKTYWYHYKWAIVFLNYVILDKI